MDIAIAKRRLSRMTGSGSDPVLSSSELDDLLTEYKVADSAGRSVGTVGYVPTWDLFGAAAEGWHWKAAKVAERYNFSQGDENFSRSQVWIHCTKMADSYQFKSTSNTKNIRMQGELLVDRGGFIDYLDQIGN